MATQEEIIKLTVQTDTSQVAGMASAVGKLNGVFTDASGRLREASGRFVTMGSETWNAAKGIDAVSVAMTKATQATEKATQATEKATKSKNGFTNLIQGTSRAFQDFTSAAMNGGIAQGFNAITNNVDQVATGFATLAGASPAMAAAIGSIGTFAVIGLQILIPVIKSAAQAMGFFADSIDPTITKVESLTGRIKELSEQKVKTEYDRTELESLESDLKRVKAAKASLDAVMQLRPDKEEASSKAVMGILKESPQTAAGVMNALIKAETSDEKIAADPAYSGAKEKIARLRAEATRIQTTAEGGGMPTFGRDASRREEANEIEKTLPEIKRRAIKAGADRVAEMMSTAEPGKQGEKIEVLAKELDKIGEAGLALGVRGSTPEKIQARSERHETEAQAKQIREAEEAAKRAYFQETTLRDREIAKAETKAETERNVAEDMKANPWKYKDKLGKYAGAGDDMVGALKSGEEADRDKFVKGRQGQYNAGAANPQDQLEAMRLFGEDGARAIGRDLAKGFEDAVKSEMASRPGMGRDQAITNVQDRARREFENPNRTDAEKRAITREGAFEDRLGEVSGIGNPIAQRMYAARMNMGGDLNAQRRKMNRQRGMTMDERMQDQARQNDQVDAGLVREGTQALLRNGVTRDPRRAAAIAMSQVAEARKQMNGETGDTGTKAAEDNTKATERLTEAIVMQTQNGVRLQLGD